jgi:hypothetical protein
LKAVAGPSQIALFLFLQRKKAGSSVNRRIAGLFTAGLPLPLVLSLALGNGLPLHVARRIRPAARERLDVVNDVTFAWPLSGARGGARMLLLEFNLCRLTAFDACLRTRRNQ